MRRRNLFRSLAVPAIIPFRSLEPHPAPGATELGTVTVYRPDTYDVLVWEEGDERRPEHGFLLPDGRRVLTLTYAGPTPAMRERLASDEHRDLMERLRFAERADRLRAGCG
jgi:hypothetical protein